MALPAALVVTRRAARVLAVGLLPALAMVAAVSLSRTEPSTRLGLSSGGAWLLSPGQSLVTLIDGPAQQVSASISLATPATDRVTISQAGSDAYLVNQTQGTVTRIDGASLQLEQPTRFADAADSLQLVLGPRSLYVVDTTRRQAALVDPVTLQVRSQTALAARTGPGQTVVDDRGRLWLVDADRGGLSWLHEGARHDAAVPVGAADQLLTVDGGPAVADFENGRVGTVEDDGTVADWACLAVRAGDDVQLAGSPTSKEIYGVVGGTGTLISSALDTGTCDTSWPIGSAADTFGAPIGWDRFVLVPDLTTGRAVVVDTDSAGTADLDLVTPGNRFELVAKDGLVFYNDLDSDTAGVLTFDGVRWQVGARLSKFDPTTGEPVAPRPEQVQAAPAEPGAAVTEPQDVTTPVDPTQAPPLEVAGPATTTPVPTTNPSQSGGSGGGPVTASTERTTRTGTTQTTTTESTTDSTTGTTQSTTTESTTETTPTTAQLTVTVSGTGTIHLAGPSGTQDCTRSCTATVDVGGQVTLTAVTGNAQTFQGWGGACTGTDLSCLVTLTADATANAGFADRPTSGLQIAITGGSHGSVKVVHAGEELECKAPGCDYPIPQGDSVTLQPGGSDNWVFTGWDGLDSCPDEKCSVTVNDAMTVSAAFVRLVPPTTEIDAQGPVDLDLPVGGQMGITLEGDLDLARWQWRARSNDSRLTVDQSEGGFIVAEGNAPLQAFGYVGVTVVDPTNVPDGVIPGAVTVTVTNADGVEFAGIGSLTFDVRTNAAPVISDASCSTDGVSQTISVQVLDANPDTLAVTMSGSVSGSLEPIGGERWGMTGPVVPDSLNEYFSATDEFGNVSSITGQVFC